ncbi:MAG: WD40 repeat domain-containing protein, partial [Bacteroidota bacterium]
NSGFIVASSDRALYMADHLTGTAKQMVVLPFEVKSINISPDGKMLAGASWSGQVIMVNLENNTFSILAEDKATRVLSVKFSPDGRSLAYGVEDYGNKRGLVKLYDLATQEIRQFTGHKAGVNDVEFSPNGKLLASAGSDKRLLMWFLEKPEDLPITMDNNNGFIWDIAFTKGSDYLIAACSESEIRVWPTDPSLLAEQICPELKRNMTLDEWKKYVGEGEDLKYESTCVGLLIKDY